MQSTDGALDIFNLNKTIKAELQTEMKKFTKTVNADLQKELKNVFDSPEFRRHINNITIHQVGTWMGATDTRLNVIDNQIGRVSTLSQAQLETINNNYQSIGGKVTTTAQQVQQLNGKVTATAEQVKQLNGKVTATGEHVKQVDLETDGFMDRLTRLESSKNLNKSNDFKTQRSLKSIEKRLASLESHENSDSENSTNTEDESANTEDESANTEDESANTEYKMFGMDVLMKPERLKQIIAMETIDENTRTEMISTAVAQVKLWLDSKIPWTEDYSHPQVYTVLGLTPAQGTARAKTSWRPTLEYVYDQIILKQIFKKVVMLLHSDKGARTPLKDRMFTICMWANVHFLKELSKEESRQNREKYEEDFNLGDFSSMNAFKMYNQQFTSALCV